MCNDFVGLVMGGHANYHSEALALVGLLLRRLMYERNFSRLLSKWILGN